MPELPEVETVRRILAPQLCGRRILGVEVLWPGVIAHPDADAFAAGVRGQRIADLTRRGKYLTLALENGAAVRLHLRMTGQLVAAPSDWPALPHTHLRFTLEGGTELRYADTRKFGRFWLFAPGEADTCSGAAALGPEPFDPTLTAAGLRAALGRRRAAIKTCLLDQHVVAGIGNIYSDEILFAACIHPARPAASLTAAEWERLARLIPAILAEHVRRNDISPADYLASGGRGYRNTPWLQVYGHAGAPCPRCQNAVLQRVVLAGRSSCFCPQCQQMP